MERQTNFSDKIDDIFTPMSWYPPITPPTSSKKDVFAIEEFILVDEKAKQAPGHLVKSFDELVEYLTAPWTTDLQKVRSIFTWMGEQQIGRRRIEHAEPNTPEYCMMKAPETLELIPVLFVMLCRTAGIPCVAVNGRMKAVTYQLGDGLSCAYGEWVIVYTDGSWRLVHPYWAFTCRDGYTDGRWTLVEEAGKAFRKRNTESSGHNVSRKNEFWFLTDPDKAIYSIHARDPEKQLLARPLTFDEFVNMPYHTTYSFESQWKLLKPHTARVETNDGVCTIDFLKPPTGNSELRYKLFFDEAESEERLPEVLQVNMYILRLKDNSGTASLLTRLPVKGIYKIEVTGHHNGRSNKLVSFLLICKSVLPDLKPFPSMPENGFGYDEVAKSVGLTEPSCSDGVVPVQQGQTADFHFHVQDDVDVRPRLKHAWRSPEDLDCHLEVRKTASELDVCVMLPEDDEYPEYSLEFTVNSRRAAGQSGNDDKNLDRFFSAVSYLLTYSKEVVEASKNEAKEIYKALEEALEGDEETLNEALENFQQNALYNPVAVNRAKAIQAGREQIRDELLAAVQSHSMERVTLALTQFEEQRLTDDGMIQTALDRLLSLAETGVCSAMASQSVEDLRTALTRAVRSDRVADVVRHSPWFIEGQDMLSRRLSDLAKAFTLTALLFLCEQPSPSRHLVSLLKATYILLGEKEEDVRDWRALQRKLRDETDGGLLKRISTHRMSQLTRQAVDMAQRHLATCDQHAVASKDHNLTVKLYTWCQTIINEFLSKDE